MYGEGLDNDGNPVPDYEEGGEPYLPVPAPIEPPAFSFQHQQQQLAMNQLTPDVSDREHAPRTTSPRGSATELTLDPDFRSHPHLLRSVPATMSACR
jgi:hypothetical protein